MRVVFNASGILCLGLGILVGLVLWQSGQPTLGVVAGALVAAAIDCVLRFGNRERVPASFLHHNGGGHLYYVPIWAFSILALITCGMDQLGAFDIPKRAEIKVAIEPTESTTQTGRPVELHIQGIDVKNEHVDWVTNFGTVKEAGSGKAVYESDKPGTGTVTARFFTGQGARRKQLTVQANIVVTSASP